MSTEAFEKGREKGKKKAGREKEDEELGEVSSVLSAV